MWLRLQLPIPMQVFFKACNDYVPGIADPYLEDHAEDAKVGLCKRAAVGLHQVVGPSSASTQHGWLRHAHTPDN
jgi:hypothetical protein